MAAPPKRLHDPKGSVPFDSGFILEPGPAKAETLYARSSAAFFMLSGLTIDNPEPAVPWMFFENHAARFLKDRSQPPPRGQAFLSYSNKSECVPVLSKMIWQ